MLSLCLVIQLRKGASWGAGSQDAALSAAAARDRGCSMVLGGGYYTRDLWSKAGETLGSSCVLTTPRLEVSMHSRRMPGSGAVINDWWGQ